VGGRESPVTGGPRRGRTVRASEAGQLLIWISEGESVHV